MTEAPVRSSYPRCQAMTGHSTR